MAASALNHPGICTVYDLVEVDGQLLIVMELVEGHTVLEAVSAGTLTPTEVVAIGTKIAAALAEAHRAGILHRDIKSGNIMLTAGGQVKVLDFGLAKRVAVASDAAGAELTREGMAVGTLSYMSPEQLLAQKVDERSDLFSLGVVLYEMVAGRRPFQGSSAVATADAILHSPPPPLTSAAVPKPLKTAIRRLLEKDPARRFASAQEVVAALQQVEASLDRQARWRRSRPAMMLGAAAVFAVVLIGGWFWHRASRARWARETAAPEIARLLAEEEFTKAGTLAEEARAVLPQDAALETLWNQATLEVSVDSVPSGASVSSRALGATPAGWRPLGRTPLTKIRVPKTYYLWRVETPGYRVFHEIWPTWVLRGTRDMSPRLDREADAPAEMVHVSPPTGPLPIPGLEHLPEVSLPDYLIDQHEVTNAEYQRFVDGGGYGKPELWVEPFVKDGRTLTFAEAMVLFRDSTGRPGPATWELGRFPKGEDRHPVVGVGWFEAAAYARFVGKSLPTIYHWNAAAQTRASQLIVPGSNFHGMSTVPVGGEAAVSGFGTTDMAGNAKEWCWNEAARGGRYILGGGFGEPTYMFIDPDAQSPWERRSNYGFRCVKLAEPAPALTLGRIEMAFRDFRKEKPVSDEVFRAYKGLYAYDRAELDAKVEEVETTPEWRREKVSFAATYGGERVIAHLYLPLNASPPFQTVVLFPGSSVIYTDKYNLSGYADFFPGTGRALLAPVYKSTFERRDGLKSDVSEPTALWRDHVIAWSKDLGRSLDYLETRPEIDRSRFAYLGVSWGGAMAPILLAVEDRFRAAVLESGGLEFQRALPEADAINFITRVKTPTLMLNGRYDHFFPEEASQRAFLQLLGTAAKDKRLVVYETGHAVPRKEFIRESIDWLDRYLGPVRR
jgi:dienelactone hydrolase